ncbi:MAG TPA: glycerophosphodiester phosphodiesterase [Candidatus Oscillibacter excrementigallinarum]|uniref:Glycerophosphodiester phosphodiesterase n=1 Tax=Candidatus Oscillibacter excrementigallinarum TaxID=2838716 RepID=A0A9D2LKD4_9FIRM|nr:glycerophosphodiester phosphodiesterase [Candidatus Oscillibacter excrementigallinarum]
MFEMLLVLAGAAVGVALLVALGYGLAWAVLHGRRDGPGWERLDGFRYAHRGLHGCGVPENSLAAFRRAAEAGYGAELDVRLTKDGRLAVIHDATLDRVCGVSGRAAELTAAALSALRLEGTEERIPFLEEVAPLFAGRAPLIVELKTDWRSAAELARRTVECLDRFSIDYCVESFDPRPLLWLRRHKRSVLRGQLSQNFHRRPSGQGLWNRLALTNLLYNVFTRPDFVAYRFGDQERLAVRLCRRSGVRMAYWTLRSWADIILAEQEGALVIFEEPDQLKEEPC